MKPQPSKIKYIYKALKQLEHGVLENDLNKTFEEHHRKEALAKKRKKR